MQGLFLLRAIVEEMHTYTYVNGHGFKRFSAGGAVDNVVAHVVFRFDVGDGRGGEYAREPGVGVLMGSGAMDVCKGWIIVVLGGGSELFEGTSRSVEPGVSVVSVGHG